ncbi:MAG TPA: family 2A encapsulin nanocompartment cargo protein cysteine desulfurase [Puia sp.]|nr:family 2A encapsulin nanocompartment cargo protein cysteine desulfurase [Puia sp.]
MSTNIDTGNVPDTELLAQLANQFFKAAPGGNAAAMPGGLWTAAPENGGTAMPGNVWTTVPENGGTVMPGNVVTAAPGGGATATPGGDVPGATGGAMAGPGVVATKIPVSVAGSGRSPSALENNKTFDVKDPQTSHPDPHFSDGRVPSSVAGSGRSPSTQTPSQTESYASGNSSAKPSDFGLKEALMGITTFFHLPQIPFPAANESPYYFLNETHPFHIPTTFPWAGPGNVVNVSGHSALVQPPFDVELIKKDFPILREYVNGRPLVWLDNAATTQKPQQVIDRISYFYQHENSNIHRAAHELAARATDAYESAREKVKLFLHAGSAKEIVFVRGATEAINLVAKSWGEQHIGAGDEVILSHLEHHANIVPWQQLAAKKGFTIKVIPVDDDGQVILEEYGKLLNSRTRLVAFTQVSNALGTITPAKQMVAMAHHAGAKALVDGAQSVSHMRVDVQDLDADWFVFSGHKVFAPTGIGVLYGKEGLLNATQPWQGGGNMIKDVTFEHTQYQDAPGRYEAGTGNIADAVGLGAALDYVSKIGMDLIDQYEHYLLAYATKLLKEVPGLRLIGTAPQKASVLSFVLDGFTNDQVGQALNKEGIAVRTGHHCAQPILRRFGLESTVRPSLAFYNTCADVHALVNVLYRLRSGR